MNKLKILSIIGLFIINTFSIGCKKKGCTDKNSDNYNSKSKKNNSSCIYRYASTIIIRKADGVYHPVDDGYGKFIKFAKKSSLSWDYITSVGSDSSLISLISPSVMFTNEDWKFELHDNDTLKQIVVSGIFNPITQGSGGSIILNEDTNIVTFNYTLK